MNEQQLITYLKATAFNAIRKISHPKYKGFSFYPDEGSRLEQIGEQVQYIMRQLEQDISKIKKGTFTKRQRRNNLKTK